MLNPAQIESSQALDPSPGSARSRFDTHTGPRSKGNRSELSGAILGEHGSIRTEAQVRPFEGFSPTEILPNEEVRKRSEGERTPQLAVPPAWTEAKGMPCVPLTDFQSVKEMKAWHDKWDARLDHQAEAACAGCPVRQACLDAAIEEERGLHYSNRYLVRGGLTPMGRVKYEGNLRQAQSKEPA